MEADYESAAFDPSAIDAKYTLLFENNFLIKSSYYNEDFIKMKQIKLISKVKNLC